MPGELVIESVVRTLCAGALDALKSRHGINGSRKINDGYILDPAVTEQYFRALQTATTALLRRTDGDLDEESVKALLQSPAVATEISKLLDPGSQIVDEFLLVAMLSERLDASIDKERTSAIAAEAWTDFFRAFSFASRSLPSLREFLRASYEAGNLLALSSITESLDRMNRDVSGIGSELDLLEGSIREFRTDLTEFRDWAKVRRWDAR